MAHVSSEEPSRDLTSGCTDTLVGRTITGAPPCGWGRGREREGGGREGGGREKEERKRERKCVSRIWCELSVRVWKRVYKCVDDQTVCV